MNSLSWSRIKALAIYYFYATKRNWNKVIFLVIWPIVDILIWGFTAVYLGSKQNEPNFVTWMLGSFILWHLVFKFQQEIACPLMDDIASRNLNNLLISPATWQEILMGITVIGFFKFLLLAVSLSTVALVLYHLNLALFEPWIIPFFINLLFFGWNLGFLASAFVFRFGYRADFLVYALAVFLQPFSCVLYARSTLPVLFRAFSYFSPASYVFEILRGHIFRQSLSNLKMNLLLATALNILYFLIIYPFFYFMFFWARKKGGLVKK